ncbi:MAG: type II secretion system minor pseudopilin GspJ [Oceanococcaceae bacterium]
MSAAPTTSQRGFTLLELVAALAIFALLAVMAYGGLNAIINTKQGVGQAQARMTQWQKGVFRLRADLESAIDRPIRDEFGDAQPALWRNPRGGLEFSRGGLRNPLQLPRSTIERVEYILQEDRLLRRSWGQLDRVQGDEGLSYPVLEGVEDLTWRYLNVDNEWIENWPPLELAVGDTANAGLPRAVELILITKPYGELRLLFAMAGA